MYFGGAWRLDQKNVTVQRKGGVGGSIGKKRYGAEKEESRFMGQKPCPVRPAGFIIVVAFRSQHHYAITSSHHNITHNIRT